MGFAAIYIELATMLFLGMLLNLIELIEEPQI